MDAFAGIDVAFAKRKRLPIVVCRRLGIQLEPLPLRNAAAKPPVGKGNARILDPDTVQNFADETAAYLRRIESEFGISIKRIAIDAPSAPKETNSTRRQCEVALDQRQIRCITTPSTLEFKALRKRAADHLGSHGPESRIPGANQLWMLVGFELFGRLRSDWECIEVFPQAIAVTLNAHSIHKSDPRGVLAQLNAVSRYTNWHPKVEVAMLSDIAYGSCHDRLDAYLAAWIASLDERDRIAIGQKPNDAIWLPRVQPVLSM